MPVDNAIQNKMEPSVLDILISGMNFPSDSQVILYKKTPYTRNNWVMFGTTETIENSRNPTFKESPSLDFFFAQKLEMRIEVLDIHPSKQVGTAEFKVSTLVTAPHQTLPITLQTSYQEPGKEEIIVILRAENRSACRDVINLQFAANFHKTFVFTPKTFASIWRYDSKVQKFTSVLSTQVVLGSIPTWPMITSKLTDLCYADLNCTLRLVVHLMPKLNHQTIFGYTNFTLNEILRNMVTVFDITKVSDKPEDSGREKFVGKLHVQHREIIRDPQFIDHLLSGLDLQTVFAFDYSIRDTCYNNPDSPHYYTKSSVSRYETIVQSLMEMLLPYSASKSVHCFGYGATLLEELQEVGLEPPMFPLSGRKGSWTFSNSASVCKHYRNRLVEIESHEVVFISPVCKAIIASLSKNIFFTSISRHHVFFFLIENDIVDIQELIDFVVAINEQTSLTIFIVGVGAGPYSNIRKFDIFNTNRARFLDAKSNYDVEHMLNFLSLDDMKQMQLNLCQELIAIIPKRVVQSKMKGKSRDDEFKRTNQIFSNAHPPSSVRRPNNSGIGGVSTASKSRSETQIWSGK